MSVETVRGLNWAVLYLTDQTKPCSLLQTESGIEVSDFSFLVSVSIVLDFDVVHTLKRTLPIQVNDSSTRPGPILPISSRTSRGSKNGKVPAWHR